MSVNRAPRQTRNNLGAATISQRPSRWSGWFSLTGFGIFLAVISALCLWLANIGPEFYHFDPPTLAEIVTDSLATHGVFNASSDTSALVELVIQGIAERYPDTRVKTNFRNPDEWMFNNAGGAMGSMFLIHASLTEYLIIFGSAVGTEGHSGIHTADDYFHILKGEQRAYEAGALDPEIYPAGSVHHLERGKVKQYRFAKEGWALEYAVGWIPPMLPFGFADTIFSTLDFLSFFRTVRITAREMVANLLRGKV